MSPMKPDELVFLGGKRTPFGANGGVLKDVSPTDLGVHASVAAIKQAGINPEDIDHVVYGSLLPSSNATMYIPRHVGLKSGVPMDRPALGINRLCGTGFQVIVEAYQQMKCGETQVALVGGVENMSSAPYLLRTARYGMRMGHQEIVDSLLEGLTDPLVQLPMAITAENLAEQYKLSRNEVDSFALESQIKAKKALDAGRFNEEIEPFCQVDKKGTKTEIANDSHARPDTTLESLAKLKPVFKKDGVVTAGNASGIVDGAASLVVSSSQFAQSRGLKPLARLVSYGVAGCDPKIMGIGPVPATKIALKKAGLSIADIDLFEVNEAFAAQALSVVKELQIPVEKLNVNGGAIAIGHPLAASGSRIMMHLIYELRRQGKRYGLGTACIGGGQGIAMIIEVI